MFQNAKISKLKQKKNKNKKTFSGISKSMVGILLYSKIERKKKKHLFSDFQNQGQSEVDNHTIFFFFAFWRAYV